MSSPPGDSTPFGHACGMSTAALPRASLLHYTGRLRRSLACGVFCFDPYYVRRATRRSPLHFAECGAEFNFGIGSISV